MKTYRSILQAKLKQAGLSQRQIASHMGWNSQGTVSLKLSGSRDWAEGELRRMAELAGVSIAWLSENSDDLVLAANKSSMTIATKADGLTEEQRQFVLAFINQINPS